MTTSTATVTVTVNADGTAVLDLRDGTLRPLHADSLDEARRQSIFMVMSHARSTGQAVTVLARDPDAEHLLEILPDGTVRPAPTRTAASARSAFAPPDPDLTHTAAPQPSPAAERPTSEPVLPVGQDRAQPQTAVALLPPEPPVAPAVRSRRRVWPLAAVGAVGLGAAAALWLWSHGSAAPTMSTVPTAPTASAATNAATALTVDLNADALGVIAAARSKAPRTAPLPGTVTPVPWDRAATWQARLVRQRDARQARQSQQAWTPAPATPTAPATAQAPAPVYRAPTNPAPAAEPPSVRIYPDPVIQPDRS